MAISPQRLIRSTYIGHLCDSTAFLFNLVVSTILEVTHTDCTVMLVTIFLLTEIEHPGYLTVKLFSKEFQPVSSQSTNVTDGSSDDILRQLRSA